MICLIYSLSQNTPNHFAIEMETFEEADYSVWVFCLFFQGESSKVRFSTLENFESEQLKRWDVFQTVYQCILGRKCALKHLQVSLQVKISSVSIILLKLSKITKLPMDVAWKISRLFDVSRSQKKSWDSLLKNQQSNVIWFDDVCQQLNFFMIF